MTIVPEGLGMGIQTRKGYPPCEDHSSVLMSGDNREADLTTVVITRSRVDLLNRALLSLDSQRSVHLRLIVIVDDCPTTCEFLATLPRPSGAVVSVEWTNVKRGTYDHSGPTRLATLRNRGLHMVGTRWCSYLDDDNDLEPWHFFTLLETMMQSRSPAIHSWRSLWTRDGKPFRLKYRHPWCRDLEVSVRLFEQYCNAGIYRVGSNVVRDQVIPYCRSKSMVDTSEWLFETEFLWEIGFVERYSAEDWETSRTEDSKLLDKIVRLGLRIPSTKKATLRYYLGGYSNNWSDEAADLMGWQ